LAIPIVSGPPGKKKFKKRNIMIRKHIPCHVTSSQFFIWALISDGLLILHGNSP